MIEILLLVLISGLSAYGLYWIYNRYEDQDDVKKMVAIFLAIIVVLMSSFLVFSATTRSIATGAETQNQAILAILLGLTGGGYSPYVKESWGGTGPEQDFDWDGIKNAWDEDADNDKVNDAWEYGTRFNPFQPDIGLRDFEARWIADDEIHIRCYSVQDLTGLATTITLFVDNIIRGEMPFRDVAEFYFVVDPGQQYTLEVRVAGIESDYANKVNNIWSYAIPAGVFGELGRWYSDLENEIQSIIRNNPLFYAANGFGLIENLFRQGIIGIPIFLWILIAAIIITLWLINRRRVKKGKPPILSFGRKKEKYSKGTTRIQLY